MDVSEAWQEHECSAQDDEHHGCEIAGPSALEGVCDNGEPSGDGGEGEERVGDDAEVEVWVFVDGLPGCGYI
jgi:hypothetical protein